MSADVYEVISLGARYWFAFLGILIVWRSFRWLRKDRKAKHRRLKQLPDAGMIGEMVVLEGSDELPEGASIPVPREGTLGFLRTCDVVVPVDGVAGKHIDFTFQDGKGLLLFPLRNRTCVMDRQTLTHRTKNKNYPMQHGSRLRVGDALLRLRLFAGLETERHSAFAPEVPLQPEQQPFPDDPRSAMPDWQSTSSIYHQIPADWSDASGRFPRVGDAWQQPWQGYPPHDGPWQQPDQQGFAQQTYDGQPSEQGWIPRPWQGQGVPPQNSDPEWTPPYPEEAPDALSDGAFPTGQARQRHRRGRRHSHEA